MADEAKLAPGTPKREEWSSRVAFYFAAVGAAVGFGESEHEVRRERGMRCFLADKTFVTTELVYLAVFYQVTSGVSRVCA